jgi:hypothetical protein
MNKAILSFASGLILGAAPTASMWAQTHKVAQQPETVVRAVGVYEWTGDLNKPTGSRFMPVTVFIDGDLEDAGIYKPQPVPFALLSGNVYELQDSGLAKGTVVLESAIDAKLPPGAPGPAFDEGWTAYGAYKPGAAPKRTATLRASKNLPVIKVSGGDGSKPHLSDKTGSNPNNTSSQPQSSDPKADSNAKDNNAPADPDRPTLHHRTEDETASTKDTSTHDSSDHDAERPTLKRRSPEEEKEQQKEEKERKKKDDVGSVTSNNSIADDPDRPHLHHGGSDDDEGKGPPKLMGIPRDMHQMVAVSDAKNRDPHPFARPWEDTNEHAAILAKMQGFARAKLAEYGVVPGVTPPSALAGSSVSPSATSAGMTSPDSGPPTLKRGIPPKSDVTSAPIPTAPTKTQSTTAKQSVHPHARARTRTGKTAAPQPVTLADEVLKGYTLSYGGAPTYVYMAHTVETGSVMRYVTIVAQDNGMGELKVALAGVTDAAHLDRAPWMRLIDAVDVEASNRASLLFELRSRNSRQFALYRVIAAKSEQIFATGGGS